MYKPGAPLDGYRRVFGTGYFKKVKMIGKMQFEHRIFAPFGDDPVLIGEITVSNKTDSERSAEVLEFFGVNLHYMAQASVYMTRNRISYGHSGVEDFAASILRRSFAIGMLDAEARRTRFAERFKFDPKVSDDGIIMLTPHFIGGRKPAPDARDARNYYPKTIFAAPLNFNSESHYYDANSLMTTSGEFRNKPETSCNNSDLIHLPCLCLGGPVNIAPAGEAGDSTRLLFIFGYENPEYIKQLVEKYRAESSETGDLLAKTAESWKKHTPVFSIPASIDSEWISRETRWHAYYARSAFLSDEHYDCHFTPQGGAYEFLHGLRGAVRDYALFLAGLIYIAPERARELLEYCFRTMTPSGRLMYATSGFGNATGAVAHESPSDLQLFLLWALTEYLFFTRDFTFLDHVIPFYPRGEEKSTVRERVTLALDYLYGTIGFGEHGLIRVGDGDWSDGISLFARDRRRFVAQGESVFNSALALYVLPRVADLLDDWNPAAAALARENSESIKQSVLKCWNGKWFYRGYDGAGHPIGNKHLFLEHHAWLLISRALPDDMAASVIKHIYEMLDEPSPFGQYVLYPPKKSFMNILKPGWDVNGGVWFAMNYLLTWGYGCYDPDKAWASLRKNSLAMKATVDPSIWYGIWSAPDCFNANHAQRPGETYFHLPTPTTDFPIMNLNVHAVYLAALIKLCGIEPQKSGITVKPLLPFGDFSMSAPTFDLYVKNNKVEFNNRFSK